VISELKRETESAFGVMSFFFDTSQKKKTGEVWQRESLRPFGVSFHEKKKFSSVKSPRQNLLEKKTGLDLFLSHPARDVTSCYNPVTPYLHVI
jgi:hypothetical protein